MRSTLTGERVAHVRTENGIFCASMRVAGTRRMTYGYCRVARSAVFCVVGICNVLLSHAGREPRGAVLLDRLTTSIVCMPRRDVWHIPRRHIVPLASSTSYKLTKPFPYSNPNPNTKSLASSSHGRSYHRALGARTPHQRPRLL